MGSYTSEENVTGVSVTNFRPEKKNLEVRVENERGVSHVGLSLRPDA